MLLTAARMLGSISFTAESVPVHDTDHGTGWGTRLVPSSSRSINITSACGVK